MPAAAPTFSTMIVWPKNSPIRCAWMRALASTPPPGAKGTTSVMVLVGQACAAQWPAAAKSAAPRKVLANMLPPAAAGGAAMLARFGRLHRRRRGPGPQHDPHRCGDRDQHRGADPEHRVMA